MARLRFRNPSQFQRQPFCRLMRIDGKIRSPGKLLPACEKLERRPDPNVQLLWTVTFFDPVMRDLAFLFPAGQCNHTAAIFLASL